MITRTSTRPAAPSHMLFDLRSRGRRRTVQFVYLGLAILLGGGLVLFGVGAGNGRRPAERLHRQRLGQLPGLGVSQQEKTALAADQGPPERSGSLGHR